MKISNNGQLNSIYNRKNISFPMSKQVADEIHQECNKPLQSKWYVDSKMKSKFDWNYKGTSDYSVRKSGGLWLVYDRKKPDKTSRETLQVQRKLYNQLKKQYELEQGVSNDTDTTLTTEDKLKAKTRKKTVNLLNGLASSPRYDRIYSNM